MNFPGPESPADISGAPPTDRRAASKLEEGSHVSCLLLVVILTAVHTTAVAQAPPGIISWWPANGNANDIVGTNDGTLENGVTFAPGVNGEAFDISPGSYVAIPDAPSLNPTNAITIEAWIYRTEEVGPYDTIVKKAGPADGPYSLEFSGNQLCFWVFTGSWQSCCAGAVPFNQWCHVAGTYDGSTISVYINGALVGASGASGQLIPSQNPINFGRDPSGDGRTYSGLIEQVRIYGRALNQLEVYAIYDGLPPLTNLPTTGPIVPELAPLQQVMTNAMANHLVNAAALALMKDDKLVLRQGYGWANEHLSAVTHPDQLFRLASVSKMLTASAITQLEDEGVISNSTLVFSYLGIPPWGGMLGDSRITNITVAELVNHSGGWNPSVSPLGDPAFDNIEASEQMGLNYPAAPTNVIAWVFSKPLDYTPGTTNVYSNFGYEVLGRIIEKASGMPYIKYIQNVLLGPGIIQNPIGFSNLVPSRSRPSDLAPWEIWYDNPGGWGPCVVDYPASVSAASADGGWYYFESFDSFGGMSASTRSLCSYLLNYWEGGDRRYPGENYSWTFTFFGALPGASTVLYQQITENSTATNGLEFAALFNGGRGSGAPSNDAYTGLMNAATNITSWPTNGGGAVQWATATTNISESAGTLNVQLIRSGLSTLPIKVSYATYATTATASNFTATSGIVTFSAGQTNQIISVPIFNTGHVDPSCQFLLELLSASGGCWLGSNLTCIVNIEGTNQLPFFSTEPRSQTVPVGGIAVFNASAQGVAPLQYQWRKNGGPILNATNTGYDLATLLSSDAGNYDVVVRSAAGSVTSSVAVLTVTGTANNCAVSAPSGLISWWSCDGTTNDRVGTNTATLENGAAFEAGEVGEAIFFNGVDGYMLVNGTQYISGPRTIETWVYPYSHLGNGMPVATTGVPAQGDMLGIAGNAGNCNVGLNNLYIDHWGTACLDSGLQVMTNTWNHVAFTYDSSNVIFYVNGVPSAPIAQSLYDFDISTLAIGCDLIGGSTTQPSLYGGIDEFRIYNRALAPSEIQAIYAAGTNGICPPTPIMFAGVQSLNKTNGFVLNASLRSGQKYRVQANTNLANTNWLTITNFTAGTAPVFSYTNSTATNFPQNFYRIVSP